MATIYYGDGGFTALNSSSLSYENGFAQGPGSSPTYITKTSFSTALFVGCAIRVKFNNSGGASLGTQDAVVGSFTTSRINITFLNVADPPTLGAYALNVPTGTASISVAILNCALLDQSNYYSTLGSVCSGCCGPSFYGGTPYPHPLNPATDTLVLTSNAMRPGGLLQGPFNLSSSAAYAGPVQSLNFNTNSIITALGFARVTGGTFSGQWDITGQIAPAIVGGTFSGIVNVWCNATITAGTFSGTVNLKAQASTPFISGGTFTGTVIRQGGSPGNTNAITGGTYSPAATVTYSIPTGTLVSSTLPVDPGFGNIGGYTPSLSVSGLPDILGAGLL